MNTKTTIAIFAAAVAVLAVALAPLVTNVDAARSTTTTCTNGGGQTKACGSPPANCETTVTRTGQGGGQGTIKDTTTTC